jgi:spermidine/putrescine transport system permease protein
VGITLSQRDQLPFLQLLHEKAVDDYQLPANVHIIVLANRLIDRGASSGLSTLIGNRCRTIAFSPSPSEVLDHYSRTGIHSMVYTYLPFMILPLYSSLEKFDWTLIEAAQDLGANTSKAFFRVMLPLTAPGLLAGSILTFVPAVGSYITVELMGGGKTTMIGRVIATQFGTAGNWPLGSAMSIVLMVIVTIAALLYFRAGRGERIAL